MSRPKREPKPIEVVDLSAAPKPGDSIEIDPDDVVPTEAVLRRAVEARDHVRAVWARVCPLPGRALVWRDCDRRLCMPFEIDDLISASPADWAVLLAGLKRMRLRLRCSLAAYREVAPRDWRLSTAGAFTAIVDGRLHRCPLPEPRDISTPAALAAFEADQAAHFADGSHGADVSLVEPSAFYSVDGLSAGLPKAVIL